MTDALLTVRWQAPGISRVLSVFPDRAWVWSLVGEAPWADRAGTFSTEVTTTECADARKVAGGLRSVTDAPPGALALLVTAGAVTRRVGASGTMAAQITEAFRALLERVASSPVSALAVAPPATPLPPGVPMLGLAFTALGSDPVELTLDPEGARARLRDGTWLTVPTARMGLVDEDTTLLDGVHVPATLRPGTLAGWALPVPAGTSADRLRIVGAVRLVGPWPDGLPEGHFELEVATTR